MRFIGSKIHIIKEIEGFIDENIPYKENMIFCDLFSGSTAVARYFKNRYSIISNDIMYFSYILQKATIELKEKPSYIKLKHFLLVENFIDILNYFEETSETILMEEFKIKEEELFIYNNYTPNSSSKRMYLKEKNGKRIDIIRISLNKLKEKNYLKEEEFIYLLACLIEGVPYVSNISGVYGAYLKYWDKRANKDFKLLELDIDKNKWENKCYNENAHELILKIKGDILYLDPPYTSRQYLPNYHVLETISRYDYPIIKGVTGMRDYSNETSKFCKKREVKEAFEQIIKEAKFRYIVMSYSTDGILTVEEIEEILKKYGIESTFKMARPIRYRQYKSKQEVKKKELHELIFFIEKNINLKDESIKDEKKYLKCPFNYIGGKHKIIEQLDKYFPTKISTFVDLFGGGFNVGINVKSQKTVYNDQITPLVELFKYFQNNSLEDILNYIEREIKVNNLNKENKETFNIFREQYNLKLLKNPLDFYILICFSFNYQIRFNNSGQFNCPHGTNRSRYSLTLKNRLSNFIKALKNKNIIFENKDFLDIEFNKLDNNSFVYCDPPYLITTGSYNDGNRGFKNWTEKEEMQLLELLDSLNEKNIKFALSNVLKHEGKENKLLINWLKERNYKVINIKSNYKNSNYQKSKKESKESLEVLIINY